MQQQGQDIGGVFGRSWQLLSANWTIIVPGIVIGIVAGIVVGFLFLSGVASGVALGSVGAPGAGVMSAMMAGLMVAVVVTIATLLSIAYTSGMAAAAWRTGAATLTDGTAAFRREGASLFVAMILLFIIGCVAVLLAPFTLMLSLCAFAIFFLYVIPSIVVDDIPAVEAITGSCRMAVQNFVPTLLIVILIGLITAAANVIGHLFAGIPLLGGIIQYAIVQAVVAYGILVTVGEYLKLRGAGLTGPPVL